MSNDDEEGQELMGSRMKRLWATQNDGPDTYTHPDTSLVV
jgi:hypothetical protein